MIRFIRYPVLILFILAIVCSSGCIVPTKDTSAPASSQSGGTSYIVGGTGSTPQPQSPAGGQNQGVPSQGPTPAPVLDTTPHVVQVPTYTVTYNTGPTYRNLSFQDVSTPAIPVFQEIYSNELSLRDYTVAYAYELINPPMIINFDIKPKIDSRTIWYESKTGSYDSAGNRADVYITTPQISPDAWFEIIVRDKATGTVVLDEGYGKTFGGGTNRTVSVRSAGNYQVDMSGNKVNVSVKMFITKGIT